MNPKLKAIALEIVKLADEYPDFRYEPLMPGTNCYYLRGASQLPTGECGCIVGIAIQRTAPEQYNTLSAADRMDNGAYVPNAERLLKQIFGKRSLQENLLIDQIQMVQQGQDGGKSWGACVAGFTSFLIKEGIMNDKN